MCANIMFKRVTYIFPLCGVTGLKVGVCDFGCSECNIHFILNESVEQSPRNEFYSSHTDAPRFERNLVIYNRTMKHQPLPRPIPFETVEVFLSLANSLRAMAEFDNELSFKGLDRLYHNCILLSCDESAEKMLNLIQARTTCVTFCSTDDEESCLVPEKIRVVVAEAFAGLAMLAVREKNVIQAVGFATAALTKHKSSLPYVNCVRMVSCALGDMQAVMNLTEMVMLPFFLRSTDPAIRALYEKELEIWDPRIRDCLSELAPKLAFATQTMTARFAGRSGVMKARYVGDVLVQKACAVCDKGVHGEKLLKCGICKKIYYCSKACQKADWKEHKSQCQA